MAQHRLDPGLLVEAHAERVVVAIDDNALCACSTGRSTKSRTVCGLNRTNERTNERTAAELSYLLRRTAVQPLPRGGRQVSLSVVCAQSSAHQALNAIKSQSN